MTDDPTENNTAPIEQVETAPPQPIPSMDANGSAKPETITDLVHRARESIPVDDRGVTPIAYAQQVTIARDLSRAYLMLPSHLHNNPAVLTALVGIAARFQLDPAMLASQSYVQNGKLCFQSQAFGAILYASGLLLGRLRYEFHGEGEDLTCTVTGRFCDDPDTICSATTPPLKLLHPGMVTKEGKGTFVKGSPLWDKDPEQQIGYFGQRRWIRRFSPDCCMGMYSAEEIAEIDDFRAARGDPLSADRLGQLNTGEGWNQGAHIEGELGKIASEEWPQEVLDPPKSKERLPSQRKRHSQARKPSRPTRTGHGAKSSPRPPLAAARAGTQARADYVRATTAWISEAVDPDAAEAKWESEVRKRDNIHLPTGERSRLRNILDRKVRLLRKSKEQA